MGGLPTFGFWDINWRNPTFERAGGHESNARKNCHLDEIAIPVILKSSFKPLAFGIRGRNRIAS